jgi:hypothetical protein
MLTLLEAAWISILFARCANFRVLCVSSLLLDAGVIVHINCSQIHSHFSMTSLQCSNFFFWSHIQEKKAICWLNMHNRDAAGDLNGNLVESLLRFVHGHSMKIATDE